MTASAPATTSGSTALKGNPADLAIGAPLLETLGNEGEVVARSNSSINLDAMGLPRNRFTVVPTGATPPIVEEPQEIRPKAKEEAAPPTVGMDLLKVLGDRAEVYGRAGGTFALEMANLLFGTILVGAVMSLGGLAIDAVRPDEPRRPAGPGGSTGTAGNGPDAATPTAPATTAATRTGDDYARTGTQTPLATVPVAEGDEPAVAVPASSGRAASTTRTAPTAASVEPAAGAAGRVVSVPVDRVVPDSIVCEVPKPEAQTKKCVLPGKPPRM